MALVPKRIGRYEVLGQLATGGMAEILLARLHGPGAFRRAVVIKRILRVYAAQSTFLKMFLDEAHIVATIRHPNVVQVQELGEENGEIFLVMEYVAGENAASLLKASVAAGVALDPRLAAYIVAEMCAGLHAAHELVDDAGRPRNLVHRDVSPQNLLVAYDGHVRLTDFGVAFVEDRAARTEPGEVKGKFEYMSPEQGLGTPLDRRSDLFSAGIVLYELSTGRRLFRRPSPARTIDAVCREPVVPPSRVVEGYPPALDAIVMRALSKAPDDRYATAAAMREELLEVVRELPRPVETLAGVMHELFADAIAQKTEMLRRVSEGADVTVPAAEVEAPADVVIPAAPEAAPRPPEVAPVAPEVVREVVPQRRTLIAIAGGVAITAMTVALLFFVLAKKGAVEAAAPPPPPRALPTDAPAMPDLASSVIVHVESKPSGARVRVADVDRGETPLDVPLPRSESVVTVELRRPGHVPVTESVVPNADQRIIVSLAPTPLRTRGPASRPGGNGGKVDAGAPPAASSGGFRRFD